MAAKRYVWPKTRLLALNTALALVQEHVTADVSLMTPLDPEGPRYRDCVFFWLPDAHCGVVWQATYAHHVAGDLAKSVAKKLEYAMWRSTNPERDCTDCTRPFLPAQGWAESGYPPDVCPACVARRLALLGPDQVLGTPYDPRAIFQRPPEPQPAA